MSESLKQKTARGLFWASVNSGATQVLNLVIGIFLARLLSPGEYGVVGMLAIFVAIAGCLQDSGFTQALINLKNPTQKDYDSVFWFNITVSVSAYVILFFCAPLIAGWFHQPTLVPLSRLLFLTFIFSAFGIVPNAQLVRQLRQREKAVISITALVVSGITGITLALNGYSYWALAWQQVVYIFIMLLGRIYYTRWLPTLSFSSQPIKKMFGFSSKILFTSIVTALNTHLLTVIFGRIYKVHDVGNYTQAAKWSTMGHSLVSGTLAQVAQPVMATLNDDAVNRQQQAFRKMLRFTAFLTFPAMFGLAIIAEEFILITISHKWIYAIPLLQILCIGGVALPFHTLYQQLAVSKGRSDIYMWGMVGLIITQLAVLLALHGVGTIKLLVAVYAALNVLWMLIWHASAGRLIHLRWTDFALDLLPFFLIAGMVMGAVYLSTQWIDTLWLRLLVRILLGAALYGAVMYFSKARIFRESIDFFKRKYVSEKR